MRAASLVVWFVGISVLIFPADACAEAPTKSLTVQDVFNLQLATDPQISPDGKRILYVRRFSDIMTDKRHSNLWIVNADGTDHRPLTTGNFNDASPRWSHDGSQIIYVSNRDGGTQIYRRWMDSGQTAKLTNLTADPAGIAWSPDNRWISFTMFVPEKDGKLIQMPTAPEGA
jgi:acylaminoacyl-peptidase